ncbi:MAG TPA: cytochrome c oxidase assembly protein [Actinomycetota bacterium]|nr:cytochrome c oxidase assembly protein [Actinomycetota bacterium]
MPPFHAHPSVLVVLGAPALAYVRAVRRRAAATGEGLGRRRATLFGLGVATLAVGASWPIHDLAERALFSVHMVQHMLFTLVAPPLLLAGTPPWMLRRILSPRPLRLAWAFVTRPVVATVVYNGLLLFTHWPAVVETSVRSEPLHLAVHVALFASALAMWWPVMSPLPELPSLPAPGQMLYLFLQSLAPTIPASFLTFGRAPLYPLYATFPRVWGIDALADQTIAGLTMKLVGGLILWIVITAIFFRWFHEEREEGWDALRWRSVEREIQRRVARG